MRLTLKNTEKYPPAKYGQIGRACSRTGQAFCPYGNRVGLAGADNCHIDRWWRSGRLLLDLQLAREFPEHRRDSAVLLMRHLGGLQLVGPEGRRCWSSMPYVLGSRLMDLRPGNVSWGRCNIAGDHHIVSVGHPRLVGGIRCRCGRRCLDIPCVR